MNINQLDINHECKNPMKISKTILWKPLNKEWEKIAPISNFVVKDIGTKINKDSQYKSIQEII